MQRPFVYSVPTIAHWCRSVSCIASIVCTPQSHSGQMPQSIGQRLPIATRLDDITPPNPLFVLSSVSRNTTSIIVVTITSSGSVYLRSIELTRNATAFTNVVDEYIRYSYGNIYNWWVFQKSGKGSDLFSTERTITQITDAAIYDRFDYYFFTINILFVLEDKAHWFSSDSIRQHSEIVSPFNALITVDCFWSNRELLRFSLLVIQILSCFHSISTQFS